MFRQVCGDTVSGQFSSLAVSYGSDCRLALCSARVLFGDVGTYRGSPHQESNDNKKARTSSELQSAAVRESVKTSEGSERKEQAASKRPAQLALFTGVYISLVGMALLVFPTSLFGETPTPFRFRFITFDRVTSSRCVSCWEY